MHLRGERKERKAAAFSDLLYKKRNYSAYRKAPPAYSAAAPQDKTTPISKSAKLEPFLSTILMWRRKTLCTPTECKYEA